MGMTLRYDRQISTKLLAAARLLRRAEDDAAGVSPLGDDEPPTSAYAFAVEIPAGDGSVSDCAVLNAIAESIRELTHVYELQEKA